MVVRRIKIEAPQNFDSASRCRYLERSREIFLAERSVYQLRYFNHRLFLIPSRSSLIPAFKFQKFQCIRFHVMNRKKRLCIYMRI